MSNTVLTDEEIVDLIATPKIVLNPGQKQKQQRSSLQVTYELREVDGSRRFRLYLRSNPRDPESYSCGLAYVMGGADQAVTLCRYNGSNHVHYNPLEDDEPIAHRCHIHRATRRYMELGDKAEKYAETTDRYSDFDGALACIVRDCAIVGLAQFEDGEPGGQLQLW